MNGCLFPGSAQNEKERATALEKGVEELHKLLQEASEQYGALERAKAKSDEENVEALQQSNTLVKELKEELDKVNTLLEANAKRGQSEIFIFLYIVLFSDLCLIPRICSI